LLGVDGLSPVIVERLMACGRIPNLARLASAGTYRRLATSNPSQSPVAWSTMASGCNPGVHGVFDFIRRDPDGYMPDLGIFKPGRVVNGRQIFLPMRSGPTFWRRAAESGIPTTVIRWPLTLPPDDFGGRMLAGMGAPDLTLNPGRYTLLTTRRIEQAEKTRLKGAVVTIDFRDGIADAKLTGPGGSSLPIRICVESGKSSLTLRVGSEESRIQAGGWSDWIRLNLRSDAGDKISGVCRFFFKSTESEIEIYVTPLQVNPREPAFDISHPEAFARELAKKIGIFSTLGVPEDTNALRDGVLSPEAFLAQCDDVMRERERMMGACLDGFDSGLLAFVFDTTDRIQHVFWSALDPGHPAHNPDFAAKYGTVIDDCYCRMDSIIGGLLSSAGDSTALLIASDHGFGSFRRAVHLNSWLAENGFLALKDRADRDRPLFRAVDWSRTLAYAVGFSSVYLNLAGRESGGIVRPCDAADVIGRIISGLESFRDSEGGGKVILNVYRGCDLYAGPRAGEAPDIVVGYAPGYRASSQTAIGACPAPLIQSNIESWPGDHLVDPPEAPGVLFSNVKFAAQSPSLINVAPTIIRLLDLPPDPAMEGQSLELEA